MQSCKRHCFDKLCSDLILYILVQCVFLILLLLLLLLLFVFLIFTLFDSKRNEKHHIQFSSWFWGICGQAKSSIYWHSTSKVSTICFISSICCLHLCILFFSLSSHYKRDVAIALGTLRSNDATTTRTSLKKWICVPLFLIAIIPTHLLCQM